MGEDECRAWSIPRGTSAQDAAGEIHSDISRGFIRAEVVAYDALIARGSMAVCRDHGEVRLEGKEYIVQDGDIINVARQPMFYIYGEVQRPGAFRLEQGMSVVQALSLGGGLTARGTQRGIKILRRDDKGAMQELDAQLADPVKKDDVIYVKESLF